MNTWKKVKIQDVTTVLGDGLHGTPKYTEDGEYAFVKGNNLVNGKLLIKKDTKRVDKTQYEKYKKPLDDRTIMVSINGTLGNVGVYNGEKVILGKSACYFNVKEEYDKDFIKYVVSSPVFKNYLENNATGTTIKNISLKQMREYEFDVPSYELQRKISGILKNIDDKIETNEAINRNLEEQAKAVFTSWFVRFECFDEPMKKSPIGYEIPESLDLVQIGDLNPILETGRRPKGGAVSEGIPSIGAESVKGLGNVNLSSNKYIPIDFAAKQKTGKVNGYELMIYKDGGKPGEFHPHFSMFGEGYPFDDFYINEHVFKLDFGNRGFNELAYFYFQTDNVMNWLESNGGKAAIPGINQNVVKSIWIVKPEHPKVKEYCEWVQPLFTQILKNCYSNMKLAELRDTLLPKLMSGELDVSDLDI